MQHRRWVHVFFLFTISLFQKLTKAYTLPKLVLPNPLHLIENVFTFSLNLFKDLVLLREILKSYILM